MTVESATDRLLGGYKHHLRVVRELDHALETAQGVTFIQAAMLRAIAAGAARPSDVGVSLGMKSQTVTGTLDRLALAGFVERRRDVEGDRRGVTIVLTATGVARLPKIVAVLEERAQALLESP